MNSEQLKEKIFELERRLELLERREHTSPRSALANVPQDENRSVSLIRTNIAKKRFAAANHHLGEFEDHIWFSVTYTPYALGKPTRAVKGVLNFSDLFGESKIRINVTVNEKLEPNRPLIQEGIGFAYNQFMPDHQWMLGTSETDMQCEFLVTHVLYADGTSEQFA